jgi:DNA-binding FrmR family transcriptional regulator
MGVLDDHVRHCVKEAVESGDSEDKLEELLTAVARFAGK